MKLASFIYNNIYTYGVVSEKGAYSVTDTFLHEYKGLKQVIDAGLSHQLMNYCNVEPVPFEKIQLIKPIMNENKILCVGMNYKKIYPLDVAPPPVGEIIIWARNEDSLVNPGEKLTIPVGAGANTFDYEGEIVVVIGKPTFRILESEAWDHVLGCSLMNEGSVRAWQKHSIHAGKNFFKSGSWGPWITTLDELPELDAICLRTTVNGEERQKACINEMIFSIPEIVSYISHIHPLNAGDIIATGSPHGSGGSLNPPKFLRHDDVIVGAATGLGALSNTVN